MGESVSGVGVLDKAVAILGVLEAGRGRSPSWPTATALPRATAHRLAVGPGAPPPGGPRRRRAASCSGPGWCARAARRRAARPVLVDAAAPVLAALRDQTGESAQLYVRSGDTRVCVVSLESPHSLRTIVAVGAALPMDRGSAAKVLAGDAAGPAAGLGRRASRSASGAWRRSAPRSSSTGGSWRPCRCRGRSSGPPASRAGCYAAAVIAAARAVEAAMAGARLAAQVGAPAPVDRASGPRRPPGRRPARRGRTLRPAPRRPGGRRLRESTRPPGWTGPGATGGGATPWRPGW